MTHHSQTVHSASASSSKGFARDVKFGQDIDLVAGLTAAALTADQLTKVADSKDHKTEHLALAGLGAAATVGALEMFWREHQESKRHHSNHSSHSHNHSQSHSNNHDHQHHAR